MRYLTRMFATTAVMLALFFGTDVSAAGMMDKLSGGCTVTTPVSGTTETAFCYVYFNAPANAATGGMGICPANATTPTVRTVSSCPSTLGTPPAAQLGTCTVNMPEMGPFAGYTYRVTFYTGFPKTCHLANQACQNKQIGGGITSSWQGVGGCI